jgi:hypothetical protein
VGGLEQNKQTNFFKASNDVFDLGLDPYQLAVYLYLTRCSNNSDSAFPSYSKIAKKCVMSERKAKEVVKDLVSLNLLNRIRRFSEYGNQSNIYKIVIPEGSAPYAPPSAQDAQGVMHDVHPGSAQDAHNKEPSYKEPSYKDINIDEFEQFWKMYPKKNGKQKALKKWKTYKINISEVLKGTQRYIDYCNHTNRFFMDGSTFVNNKSWEDDWEIAKGGQAFANHEAGSEGIRHGGYPKTEGSGITTKQGGWKRTKDNAAIQDQMQNL